MCFIFNLFDLRIEYIIYFTLMVLCSPEEFNETSNVLSVITCPVNLCQNEGICYIDHKHPMKKQFCACKPEYVGDTCNYLNPCLPGTEICRNGGTCVPEFVNDTYTFMCTCPQGYVGKWCENRDWPKCEPETCNGGTCSYNGTEIYCECPRLKFGTRCELINHCADNPCKNAGTCIVRDDDYSCLCAPGWTGKNCSDDIDECSLGHTCIHGGTCINLPGSFDCVCPERWSGDNQCFTLNDPCVPDPCQNGGNCMLDDDDLAVCSCQTGWKGKFCEVKEKVLMESCPLKTFCLLNRNNNICNEECNVAECDFDGADCSGISFISSLAIDFSIGYNEFVTNKMKYMKILEDSMHIMLQIKRNDKGEELIFDCSNQINAKCVRVILSLQPKCDPEFPQFCLNSTLSVVKYFEEFDNLTALPFKVTHVQSYAQDSTIVVNESLRVKILIVGLALIIILIFALAVGIILKKRAWVQNTKKLPKHFSSETEETAKPADLNNAEKVKIPEESKQSNVSIELDSSIISSTSPVNDDVNASGPNGLTPLMTAIMQKDITDNDRDIQIRELVSLGADLLRQSDLTGETVFHLAVRYNRINACRTLAKLCPQLVKLVDKHERTPLHAAACIGSVEITRMLVRCCQADLNAVDANGYTAMQLAIELEQNDVLEELLRLGASPNFIHPKSDVSALHCAARVDNVYAITQILNYDGYVDILNEKTESPLLLAAREGNNRACMLLLNYGAVPDIVSALGESALDYAVTQRNDELLSMLQNAISKRTKNSPAYRKKGRGHKRSGCCALRQAKANFVGIREPLPVIPEESYVAIREPSSVVPEESYVRNREPLAVIPIEYANIPNFQAINHHHHQQTSCHIWNHSPDQYHSPPDYVHSYLMCDRFSNRVPPDLRPPCHSLVQRMPTPNFTIHAMRHIGRPRIQSQSNRTEGPSSRKITFV